MKTQREDLELQRKHEIHEVEERKNTHINQLMKKHDVAFTEIKNYYNDITHNNLDLIKTLKDDVAEMKKKEATNDQLMYEISQENKRLSEPLTAEGGGRPPRQLASYEKDKSLTATKKRLADSEKSLKNLEWEHEVQTQRFAKVRRNGRALRQVWPNLEAAKIGRIWCWNASSRRWGMRWRRKKRSSGRCCRRPIWIRARWRR